ncbi:DUF3875 domain-containing protein [Chryseobacterium sp. LC2016-29]|uniref:TraG/VirB4 family ATPase n=1 Tax=Chryseobacterium sp. LC2016-29 TaxID=2897331 RepID=UPI001E5CE0EB|nr:DUF3875 domain-containing protein [Chryseobacterium sp. LC2016-29]MCD0480382.1 DUF3875 domain-containing protein [Chryseobacterium sp. LC2016-29]
MSVNLKQEFPIYTINDNGVIISTTEGVISVCYKIRMPEIFTLSKNNYEEIVNAFNTFTQNIGENTLIHKQDFYFRDIFSLINENEKVTTSMIDKAYIYHFNERPYIRSEHYLFISKLPDNFGKSVSEIISKEYATTSDNVLIQKIESGKDILKGVGIEIEKMSLEELESLDSPIYKFLNFSNAQIPQVKDIDFSGGNIYVGNKKVNVYSINDLEQFPELEFDTCKLDKKQGLNVSNFFAFGHKLKCPHVSNTFIYYPSQRGLQLELDKLYTKFEAYHSVKTKKEAKESSNKITDEKTEIVEFKDKMERENGVYYHFNVFAFDEKESEIEKNIDSAFEQVSFVKKESSIMRKDLFFGSIGSNGARLARLKGHMMSLISGKEAFSLNTWEQNYFDTQTQLNGVRLCDRTFGIPKAVDLFDEPKRKGLIDNKNAIIMSGSGGGKSYFTNLVLSEEYKVGSHIFCIDASYSYRLNCRYHNGVYLTYDDHNVITFNPFYTDWIDNKHVVDYFRNQSLSDLSSEDQILGENVETNYYTNLLRDKVNTIIGVLSAVLKTGKEEMDMLETTIISNITFAYYKHKALNGGKESMKFDDYYNFVKSYIHKYLEEEQIEKSSFDPNNFLLIISSFRTGQLYGNLLNSMDKKIMQIENERFVVIDVARIKDNPILYTVVSVLAMDLYNQKIAKLGNYVNKLLVIDEAWQSISSPKMATFMKAQVKIIRKYEGQTIFISQELDDFLGSDIIKESIVKNSDIKIFANMGNFLADFEKFKTILNVTNENEELIRSINKDLRPDAKYKEVCILYKTKGIVYGVETPFELKAIFETDMKEVKKIMPNVDKYGVELAMANYAEESRK